MPLSVIVCLMDETTLNVWPKSIGLSTRADDTLADHEPIKCKVVHLKKGDILAFRGDLVHAGSGYDKDNWRMHAFLDSEMVERKANATWIIHKHAGDQLKRIIQ